MPESLSTRNQQLIKSQVRVEASVSAFRAYSRALSHKKTIVSWAQGIVRESHYQLSAYFVPFNGITCTTPCTTRSTDYGRIQREY